MVEDCRFDRLSCYTTGAVLRFCGSAGWRQLVSSWCYFVLYMALWWWCGGAVSFLVLFSEGRLLFGVAVLVFLPANPFSADLTWLSQI